MRDSHREVALSFQRAREQLPCVILLHHRTLQLPNIAVKLTLSMEKEKHVLEKIDNLFTKNPLRDIRKLTLAGSS